MGKGSNIEWWEKALINLPESYINWFKEEGDFLRKNIYKDSSVLEVGCGEGRS